MIGEMMPYDRIMAAIELQPVDRVPVAPKIDTSFAARSQGVKLAEVVRDANSGQSVLERTWESKGVPTLFGFGPFLPLEGFRFTRSLQALIADLYRRPEKVIAASEACLDEQIPLGIEMYRSVKQNMKWGYISIQIGQTTGTMLSPRQFEKFYWPFEKKLINSLVEAGVTPWLHCDSNWTPYLEYFLELPRGKVVLDIDGTTDIFKAKAILKGHMCIPGDVPATLLKLGTPAEVSEYCKKLIDVVGDGGGFILSSGCSVPVDARPENVKALVDTGKNYYPHRRAYARSGRA